MRFLLPNVGCLPESKYIYSLNFLLSTWQRFQRLFFWILGKQLTFGSNSLISEAEDAVSSPTHSLIFNQVQSGSTTGSGSGSMGGASGKKAGGTDSVDFPFQFNFGSIYSSSLTIYFDNWAFCFKTLWPSNFCPKIMMYFCLLNHYKPNSNTTISNQKMFCLCIEFTY